MTQTDYSIIKLTTNWVTGAALGRQEKILEMLERS